MILRVCSYDSLVIYHSGTSLNTKPIIRQFQQLLHSEPVLFSRMTFPSHLILDIPN